MDLSQAISLSNVAVPMMQAGNYKNAIACLTEAIKALQRLPQDSFLDSGNTQDCCDEEAMINAYMATSRERQNAQTYGAENDLYLFRQGIPIPPSVHPRYIASIVIFNLAVTCQLQGIAVRNGDEHRQQLLKKASHLYELSLQAYQEVGGSTRGLLAIATTNNNAVVCFELGDMDRSRRCLQTMYMALAHVARQNDTGVAPFAHDFLKTILALGGFDDCHAHHTAAAA
eukprot:scaffold408_cov71-Cylindrotheca_fusiformis.AAC.24